MKPEQSKCYSHALQHLLGVLLLPSSVAQAEWTIIPAGWCQTAFPVVSYRGRRRQDDISDGGFELVDVRPVLMRAVIRLNGLDLHVELPGLVFVLGIAGRIEGVVFGM